MIFTVSISDMIAETNLDSSFLFIQFQQTTELIQTGTEVLSYYYLSIKIFQAKS